MILKIIILFLLVITPAAAIAEGTEAITRPSEDVMLSFVRGGRVSSVLVKEGDRVKKGRLLARQEDRAEQIQLKQLTAKAGDTTLIEEAEVRLAQKEKDLQKLEWAQTKGAATDWEVEHARLDVRLSELALQLAKFEHEQDILRRDELKVQVKRLRLSSPVSGLVEEVAVDPGESAEPLKPVIRVVQINPLWIDAPVPLAEAGKIKPEQSVYVKFSGSGGDTEGKQVKGKVRNVSVVAHSASDTLRVRIEVPNPSFRPAGERVIVTFPESDSE